jgi:hypothetical protein
MTSAANSAQRMRAFEITRENMERMLIAESVEDKTEFGISEMYPDIQWQTTVECISAPTGDGMWAQAFCSAEYTDAAGEVRTVELTHWLTELTKEQMEQIESRRQQQEELLAEHIIETQEDAAVFAGVDIETIGQWVASGMPMTESRYYLKPWLILYYDTGGQPTAQDKQDVLNQYPGLPSAGRKSKAPAEPQQQQPGQKEPGQTQPPSIKPEDLPPDMVLPPEMLPGPGK